MKNGDKILDIGCGSGILSVGGLLFGGGYADLADIDKNAAFAVDENMKTNGILPEKYTFFAGDILSDDRLDAKFSGGGYDIVCANIVADIVSALSEKVGKYLKKGGIFISSGVIAEREKDVERSLAENGFDVVELKKMGNWRAFTAKISLEE